MVIALYGVTHHEANIGAVAERFRGLTLNVNLASFADCLAVYSTLAETDGVALLEEPCEQFWGGGFSWRDPEGNIWDVA